MNKSTYVKIIVSTLLLSISHSCLWAQDDTRKFTVEISNDSILMGNQFSIKYTLENIEGEFEAPEFTDMDIISGPNVSSSFHVVNGVSSSSKIYTYILQARKEGETIIDPAYILGDEPLETDYVKVNVYPNPEGIRQNNNFKNSGTEFFFSFPGDDFWGRKNPPIKEEPKKKKSKRVLKKL